MSSSAQVHIKATTWSGGQTMRTPNQTLRIYFNEAKYEFLKLLRLPIYAVSTIAFPLMFYVLFGLVLNQRQTVGSISVATYLLASYGAFGVIGASLFGFGVGVATERGQGWLQVKRASPMPPFAYFLAKLIMSSLFSLIVVLLLFTLGAAFGHVRMPLATWAALAGTLVMGALPFGAMGLAIGYFAGPNSAPAVCNVLYLPMAFASGLWVPIEFLPKFMQSIAPFLPPYHFVQLALAQVGAGHSGGRWVHIAALNGFTLLFLVLAAVGYRRDEGKMYG
jgi:ABC-2 type transport system permease protein